MMIVGNFEVLNRQPPRPIQSSSAAFIGESHNNLNRSSTRTLTQRFQGFRDVLQNNNLKNMLKICSRFPFWFTTTNFDTLAVI